MMRRVIRKPAIQLTCAAICLYIFYTLILVICMLAYDQNYYSYQVVDIQDIFETDQNKNTFSENGPVLTLVTTFKDTKSRREINENTIKCWAALSNVVPVMYVEPDQSSSPLVEFGLKLGWKVYIAPGLRNGYPVIKDMVLHTLMHVKPETYFVGYANSDILFSESLVHTLDFLKSLKGSVIHKKGIFASGQRINTVLKNIKFGSRSGVLNSIDQQNPDEINHQEGDALDYFIFTRSHFPWNDVPDFVVGKPGFDNWFIIKAQDLDIVTIDTSLSVNAIHQVLKSKDTNKGWLSQDVCLNRNLLDPFDYTSGHTYCLKYFTRRAYWTSVQDIVLYKRYKFHFVCSPYIDRSSFCNEVLKSFS